MRFWIPIGEMDYIIDADNIHDCTTDDVFELHFPGTEEDEGMMISVYAKPSCVTNGHAICLEAEYINKPVPIAEWAEQNESGFNFVSGVSA